MTIQTEPIGSMPRPRALIEGIGAFAAGRLPQPELDRLYEAAIADTIKLFEASGSPVITDGEQTKPSFATYPIQGMKALSSDGVTIPFADGHTRRLPVITAGPFRYQTYAEGYLNAARRHTRLPIKQAVISASALSLLYPSEGIPGYSQETFLSDLLRENETDIRRCLQAGAHTVQIDFTEGRLALKLDPSGELLQQFVNLNNKVLNRFSSEERKRIGVHTCPGGDRDSTHSADVDYRNLLPRLFQLNAGNFYLQLASERNPVKVLRIIREQSQPHQRIFIGVTDPINPRVETAEEVKARILEAAAILPLDRLGTTDDCGFSPFGDDTSTSRETAFAKVRARIDGTMLAARSLEIA
jgi:5-methyltetrahydropteroyltriglutamate--homocysteine methyltransferase